MGIHNYTSVPVRTDDGQLLGLLGVVKDVTLLKKAEAVLRNGKAVGS